MPAQLDDGRIVYRTATDASLLEPAWRLTGFKDGKLKLASGGQVVGSIPSGVPGINLPPLDFGVMSGLFATAFIMAMIGFMEATSISRALAAKTREKLDPNQELIGQGLANIVGSFFQSYVVSGSFSRSAVAAKSGARSGFYAIVSALGVLLVMLFLTGYLYHLPQPVLAAIVMSAVFGLLDFKSMLHAWNVRRADGVIGLVTFITTLIIAPQLADGVLVGVVLTILLFLAGTMSPRSEVMGRTSENGVQSVNRSGARMPRTSNMRLSPAFGLQREKTMDVAATESSTVVSSVGHIIINRKQYQNCTKKRMNTGLI